MLTFLIVLQRDRSFQARTLFLKGGGGSYANFEPEVLLRLCEGGNLAAN